MFLLAASSLLIAACSQTVFLVQRDVPSSPTFTVIPANDYLYQVDFATQIEGHLISCGVKVIVRPVSKEIETRKSASQTEAFQEKAGEKEATQIERYHAVDETSADYIIQSYAEANFVKIIRRTTGEVLAAFEFKTGSRDPFSTTSSKTICEALTNLGIKTK
jgi:hypothetical protein